MERENICVMGPCTRSSTTCMRVQGGLSSPSGRCRPPGGPRMPKEAGWDSQEVFTQEARAAGQAGKPSQRRD